MVDEKRSGRRGVVRKASTRGLGGISNRELVLQEEILKGGAEEWGPGYDCWLWTSPKKTILADVKSLKMTLNSKKKADLKGP